MELNTHITCLFVCLFVVMGPSQDQYTREYTISTTPNNNRPRYLICKLSIPVLSGSLSVIIIMRDMGECDHERNMVTMKGDRCT